MSNILGQY